MGVVVPVLAVVVEVTVLDDEGVVVAVEEDLF